MEPRDSREVSGRPSGHLSSRQNRDAISSLNEAWLHTLDEYVATTPLSQVILRFIQFCCSRRVMAIRLLAISLAFSPNSRDRDPQCLTRIGLARSTADEPGESCQGIGYLPRRQRQCR